MLKVLFSIAVLELIGQIQNLKLNLVTMKELKKANLQKYIIIKIAIMINTMKILILLKKYLKYIFQIYEKKPDSKLYYENVKYINEEEAEEGFDDDEQRHNSEFIERKKEKNYKIDSILNIYGFNMQ